MKLIVDTNVFVSGIFFTGPPHLILDAWRHGSISLVLSPEILDEYQRVGARLATKFYGRRSPLAVGTMPAVISLL